MSRTAWLSDRLAKALFAPLQTYTSASSPRRGNPMICVGATAQTTFTIRKIDRPHDKRIFPSDQRNTPRRASLCDINPPCSAHRNRPYIPMPPPGRQCALLEPVSESQTGGNTDSVLHGAPSASCIRLEAARRGVPPFSESTKPPLAK